MKDKNIILLLLLIAVISPFLIVNSCVHDPYGVSQLDTVCFDTQILPILQTSCGISGCHDANSAKSDFVVDDYESILAIVEPNNSNKSLLYKVITDFNGELMPPDRPLTKEQRSLIMVWIEQGAKNTICFEDNEWIDTLNYDTLCFNQVILPIFQSSCGKPGCHNAASHEGDYTLISYSTIMQDPEGIVPFNPNESKIFEVITTNESEDIMPPPPNAPLTQEQIENIRKWIMEGALNSDCPWTACDTTGNISFSEQIWPMVQNNCLACHTESNPSGGVNLSNYTQIKYYSETQIGGIPIIIGSIRHMPGFVAMPPSGMLNVCQLREFELWIEQGMLDN